MINGRHDARDLDEEEIEEALNYIDNWIKVPLGSDEKEDERIRGGLMGKFERKV